MGNPKKGKGKAAPASSGSSKKKGKKKAATAAAGEGPSSSGSEPMAVEDGGPSAPAVWRPGLDNVEEGEELQYDPTAYDCMHVMSLDWPCLSFDIVRDELGGPRSTFPHTITFAAGTQAAAARQNAVALAKLSNLGQGKHGAKAKQQDDSDDEMSDSEDEDGEGAGGEEGPPVLHARQVAPGCGINRVRCMPQRPGVVAAWGDSAQVQVWDLGMQLAELAAAADERAQRGRPLPQRPRQNQGHAQEGYALDWSRVAEGRLAAGDCASSIRVWDPNEKGGWSVGPPYQGHEGSVEDVQWSPTEGSVFASCSVDQTIRIWDTRTRAAPQLTVRAHGCDVNVISWNALATFMLASGADDGGFRVWDLRTFGANAKANEEGFVATFTYHRGPVTSIEWCPFESSMLSTTSGDGQLALWDLALERDPEEEAALAAHMNAASPDDLPPQLLFVHLQQGEIKEAHWHPQIPGMLISTGLDGFNIFKPSNVP